MDARDWFFYDTISGLKPAVKLITSPYVNQISQYAHSTFDQPEPHIIKFLRCPQFKQAKSFHDSNCTCRGILTKEMLHLYGTSNGEQVEFAINTRWNMQKLDRYVNMIHFNKSSAKELGIIPNMAKNSIVWYSLEFRRSI